MSSRVPGRVSVIIPSYNTAKFVHRAIENALNQTYPDVEVIVVDDCSSDNWEEVFQPYLNRIVFHRNSVNSGFSATCNIGASHSTGEMLAFLDADDWWPEDFLEKLVPFISPNHAVCYDNYLVPEAEIQQPSKWSPNPEKTLFTEAHPWKQEFLNRTNMDAYFQGAPILKILMHHSDFDRVKGFDTRFFGMEDFQFFVKLLANDVHFKIVSEPKGYYLVRSTSVCRAINLTQKKDISIQLRAARSWLMLYKTMPNELRLSEKVLSLCRDGERYWSARYAENILLLHLKSKNFQGMMNQDFIQTVVPTLPSIVSFKLKNAVRKLQARFRTEKSYA